MATTMIALVGGQPLPNLIPVRHYVPESVLLVYTNETRNVFSRLKETLASTTDVYEVKTDSYNTVSIIEAIQNRLEQPDVKSNEFIFNLTGATKAMALAAYHVAQQRSIPFIYMESEQKQSHIYRYSWDKQQPIPMNPPSEIISPEITLTDFLNVQFGFGDRNWKEIGSGRTEGTPFENAIAEALRSQGYEVMVGVQAALGQVDLDVVVRVKNQFGVIEAKSGENGKKLDGIKQLNNASRQLGTFTKLFYVITVEPSRSHQAVVEASKIQVISLRNYVQGEATLSQDDETTFIEAVKEIMEG